MNKYLEIKNNIITKENILAKNLTTYKTGGIIDIVCYPKNKEEIIWLLKYLKENGIKYFIFGEGSNILVSDKGFKGVFISSKKLNFFEIKENNILAESGVLWDFLVEKACLNGFKGLEKTSLIPGSVGGAVRMNAGAFGQEVFDRLISFDVFDKKDLNFKTIRKEEIKYSYRFVENIENYFIYSALFSFDKDNSKDLMAIREDIIKKRYEKQPLNFPSGGSVFKRPENDYASRLIEICGLKGLKINGAMVSEKHSGFIVNYDNATSSDVYNLIVKVREEVLKKTNIKLQLEQILVGDF